MSGETEVRGGREELESTQPSGILVQGLSSGPPPSESCEEHLFIVPFGYLYFFFGEMSI